MFKKLVFYNQQNRRFVRVKVRRYYLHNSKGGMKKAKCAVWHKRSSPSTFPNPVG